MYDKIAWCSVLLCAGLSGCSMMTPTQHISEVESPAPPVQNFAARLNLEENQSLPDFNQLQPGSYCMLVSAPNEPVTTNESTATNRDSTSVPAVPPRTIAGRIVTIDETKIVLADAISISSRPPKPVAVPTTTKVVSYVINGPFVPRLFKLSGVGRETIAIPGEVTIDRASIRNFGPVDGTHWDQTQNSGSWFERIGTDFDFNVVPIQGEGKPLKEPAA